MPYYTAHQVVGFTIGCVAVALFWFTASRANRLLLYYLKEREIFLTVAIAKRERQRRLQIHSHLEQNNPWTPTHGGPSNTNVTGGNNENNATGSIDHHQKRTLLSGLGGSITNMATSSPLAWYSDTRLLFYVFAIISAVTYAFLTLVLLMSPSTSPFRKGDLESDLLSLSNVCAYLSMVAIVIWTILHGIMMEWRRDHLTTAGVKKSSTNNNTIKSKNQDQIVPSNNNNIISRDKSNRSSNANPMKNSKTGSKQTIINVGIDSGDSQQLDTSRAANSNNNTTENNTNNTNSSKSRENSEQRLNNREQTRRSSLAAQQQQQRHRTSSHPTMSGDIGNDTEDQSHYYDDDDDYDAQFVPSYRGSRADGGDDDEDNEEEEYSKYFQAYGSTDDLVHQQQQHQHQQTPNYNYNYNTGSNSNLMNMNSSPPHNNHQHRDSNSGTNSSFLHQANHNNSQHNQLNATPITTENHHQHHQQTSSRSSSALYYSNTTQQQRNSSNQQQQGANNNNHNTMSSSISCSCNAECFWRVLEFLYPYRLMISILATLLFYIAIYILGTQKIIDGEDFSAALSGFLGVICGVLGVGSTTYLWGHGAKNAARRFGLALMILCICLIGRCAMVTSEIQRDIDSDLTYLALPFVDAFAISCVIVVLPSRKFCLCFDSYDEN